MCLGGFGRIYNDVPQSVAIGDSVLFNKNGILKGTIAHVAGSSELLLCGEGYYEIFGKVFHEFAVQMGVYLNGVLLTGSVVGEAAAASILLTHTLVGVAPGDLFPNTDSPTGVAAILQIRNHISYIPITLDGREGSGEDLTQINASMMVIQLCDKFEERF
jgi:hypothetical protein